MSPQFNCGDYVVLLTVFKKRFLAQGQRVVFDHPQYGRMIKEIVSIDQANRTYTAKGLNTESVSTQQIGAMPFDSLVGRVIWTIKPSAH